MLIKKFFNKKINLDDMPCAIKPKSVSIEVSDNCNLRCRICNQWKEQNNLKKLELKDFKKLIDEISGSFQDTTLEFSGPEPLTSQKLLFRALSYAQKKAVKTAISTNGALISRGIAEKLIAYNLNHISVSLDSPNPEVQDYLRNCKGLFGKNISSIKNLIKAKQKSGSKTIISITCTITDYNTSDLMGLYGLCRSLNVDSVNYNAYVIDNSYFNKDMRAYEKDEFWVKSKNIPNLKKNIKSIILLANRHGKPTVATPLAVLEEVPAYFEKKELFHKGTCKAGSNYFHITNFGEVTVCGKGPHLNIKDYPLRDILRSEDFFKTLDETKKCKTPCLNNCFYLK